MAQVYGMHYILLQYIYRYWLMFTYLLYVYVCILLYIASLDIILGV